MALNLVTKAEYKTYAGIKSTNQDAEIDFLIPLVSAYVKNYCRRTFVDYMDTPNVEYFNGGTDKFMFKETPLVNIVSINYSEDYGQTYTQLVEYTDWVKDGDYVVSLNPLGFEKKLKGYMVTYYAGFEDVPQDLTLAILDLIKYYLRNDSAVHSSKAPGTSAIQIEYISTTSLPANIRRIFDLYVQDYS